MKPDDQLIDLGDRRLARAASCPVTTTASSARHLCSCTKAWGIEMCATSRKALRRHALPRPGLRPYRLWRLEPWPGEPGLDYMEVEADLVLPRLLAALGIADCVLVATATAARSLSTMRCRSRNPSAPW